MSFDEYARSLEQHQAHQVLLTLNDTHAELAHLRGIIAGQEVRRVMDERAHQEAVGELLDLLDGLWWWDERS